VTEETFYSPAQIGERWGISKSAAHRIFCHKPGVLRITSGVDTKRRSTRHVIRIPASVLERVEEEFREKPVQNRYRK
jgi:hypothetical protein